MVGSLIAATSQHQRNSPRGVACRALSDPKRTHSTTEFKLFPDLRIALIAVHPTDEVVLHTRTGTTAITATVQSHLFELI